MVKKGQRLSLQRHAKRSEWRVMAKGRVRIQKGNRICALLPEDPIFIKKKEFHRLEALTDAVIIEISFGRHSELDIVRLADDYRRTQ